ncbi:MAG: hypothetical protein AB1631_20085 [Acidobacteriota bacterium]
MNRAKTIAAEMKRLSSEGRKAEMSGLAPQLVDTFSPRESYLTFARQINGSPVIEAINSISSLLATIGQEEMNKNSALLALNAAVKFIAPSARVPDSRADLCANHQPQIVKAGYNANALSRRSGAPLQADCQACIDAFVGLWLGCIDFDLLCTAGGGGWECDLLLLACWSGDVAFVNWCLRNC